MHCTVNRRVRESFLSFSASRGGLHHFSEHSRAQVQDKGIRSVQRRANALFNILFADIKLQYVAHNPDAEAVLLLTHYVQYDHRWAFGVRALIRAIVMQQKALLDRSTCEPAAISKLALTCLPCAESRRTCSR